jgi:hypothetical protein
MKPKHLPKHISHPVLYLGWFLIRLHINGLFLPIITLNVIEICHSIFNAGSLVFHLSIVEIYGVIFQKMKIIFFLKGEFILN